MVISMVGWWYSLGWAWLVRQVFYVRLKRIIDFFSITELITTLFSPFRRDFIDTKRAPVGLKIQAFFGNIISRIMGLLIRLALIFSGLIVMAVTAVLGFFLIVLWPFVPISPILTIILAVGSI